MSNFDMRTFSHSLKQPHENCWSTQMLFSPGRVVDKLLEAGAEVIGINNRDLRTFTTDLSVTERLAPLVPRGKQIVSESGIFTREHFAQMNRSRVNAVLVGEALVTAPDIGEKVRELTGQKAPAA